MSFFSQNNSEQPDLGEYLKRFIAPYYDGIPDEEKNKLLERITGDEGNKRYSKSFVRNYRIDEKNGNKVYKFGELKDFPNINSRKFKKNVYPTDSDIHKKAKLT